MWNPDYFHYLYPISNKWFHLSVLNYDILGMIQAVDFLDKLLRYDHQDRLTAREAMVCNFFPFMQGDRTCFSRLVVSTFLQVTDLSLDCSKTS